MPLDLLHRVARFLEDPGAGSFDDLALAAFAFQVERIPAWAALAGARGARPGALSGWRDVPPLPALAYKSLDLAPRGVDLGGAETFCSSGTTGGSTGELRSVHVHPFLDLYRTAIDASFPRYCLPTPPPAAGLAVLSLVPPREVLPDSSLSFMVDHVVRRWGLPGESAWAFRGPGREGVGLDAEAARRWAARRAEDGRPGLVLATALALAAWLDRLEAAGERHRLPAGTVLFETGGFKGRRREVARPELLARAEERLGVPPERVVREYGMTELTSQLYTGVLAGGDPDLFVAPPWVRVRVLDPETLEEEPPGAPGLVAVFDLANLSSAVHLLTEDLGAMETGGLRLLGRATGAELRGCSLTAEELVGG